MRGLLTRIGKAYREGRLFSSIQSQITPYLSGLKFVLSDPAGSEIVLHCPDYIKPSSEKAEREIVERIFHAYRRMKEDQKHASKLYLPSSLWQDILDTAYSPLTTGLKNDDLDTFHFFLANFGTWKENLGIESTTLIRDGMRSFITRRFLKNVVFFGPLKRWQWFNHGGKPLGALTYPVFGNQAGAYVGTTFIGVGSFYNEICGSLLSGLISDRERPVVADLGGGYGKLAYFTLQTSENFCFIDFDLPETLCLAAYYLMKTWPEKRTLLYGEEDYSPASHHLYDLIFMPSYEIGKIGENSVDLFMNKNSLGEMTGDAVFNFMGHITRATRYFFHSNHELHPVIFSEGRRGLLGYEYPVPGDRFKLLMRYLDLGHVISRGSIDYNSDIFFYLYEKRPG